MSKVVCCLSFVAALVVSASFQNDGVLANTSAIATGNWSDAGTWDNAEPSVTSSAFINGGFTVTIDQAGEETNLIDLGTASGATGHLQINPGADLTIKNTNPANFPSTIRVGQVGGSEGTLTMTGGNVSIQGAAPSGFAIADLLVGDVGKGTMTMSAGTFTVAHEIFVGLGGPSDGTLNVSGGTLTSAGQNLVVAFFNGAKGAFNLSDTGTVVLKDAFISSLEAGATSTINQTGGKLDVGNVFIHGLGGASTYNHSGGLIEVHPDGSSNNGDFIVADSSSNAVYNISGTASVDVGRDLIVGVFNPADGKVNQSGGTVEIAGALKLGNDGKGKWTQSGGTTTVGGSVSLGNLGASSGEFTSSGGELTVVGDLAVGTGPNIGANGTFIVSGAGGSVEVEGRLLANPLDNGGVSSATLRFDVVDNSGISTIDVGGAAALRGAIIDVNLLGGSFGIGSYFDLISAASIGTGYVPHSSNAGSISLSVVTVGNSQVLRATVVPEPAALLLIAAAVPFFVQRRRYRRHG